MPEAAAEFGVRLAQSLLGIDAQKASQVYDREQQIANFFLARFRRPARTCFVEFADLLTNFVENLRRILPIETGAGGLRRDLPRLDKRWRIARNGIEQAIRLLFVFALFGLDLVPPALHVVRRFRIAIPEDMRVAANQFVTDRIERVFDVELSVFRGELRFKHRLQQQVAQFIGKAAPVARIDGVENLVSLLEQIRL